MPSPQRALDGNKNPTDRRFLLFQLDLSKTKEFSALNKFTARRDSSSAGSNFKFIDPSDYEDVSSPLYWRRVLDPKYKETFSEELKKFRDGFISAIGEGKIHLRQGAGTTPFRDITPLVKRVSGFSVSGVTNANDLQLDLGPTESLAEFNIARGGAQQARLKLLFEQKLLDADISENDVIMTRVSYDGGASYQMEYLGFITKVGDSRRYGAVDNLSLLVTGVSKIFEINSIVKQRAIRDDQFLTGIEVNNTEEPSVYASKFESMNTGQIFADLMKNALALLPQPGVKFEDPNLLAFYNDDSAFFPTDSKTQEGFQFNAFVLLTLELMSIETLDPENQFYTSLFPKVTPIDLGLRTVLDSKVRAILEHGEHQTYNAMIASGFETFFAQMANVQSIFSEIKSHTYYDIFEARTGVIICRPPRYNKIEINNGELERTNLDQFEANISNILVFDNALGRWTFNPDADFFIGDEDLAGDIDFDNNDATLKTHVDMQYTMRGVGVEDYPAGSYTDPNLMARYGLRTAGPINNPNATNFALCHLFAPIALNIDNAATRTAKVKVWDTRPYQVCKLYFLASENVVGYCVGSTITSEYQKLGDNDLDLIMIRRVVDRPISEIYRNDDEVFNFAMMYLRDFTPDKKNSAKAASKTRSALLSAGREMLDLLGAGAAESKITIPMFKYVPNILDLVIDVEDTPSRIDPQSAAQDTSEARQQASTRRRQTAEDALVAGDDIYASDLVRLGGDPYAINTFSDLGATNGAPDVTSSKFFPAAGAYRYAGVVDSGFQDKSKNPIRAVKTPFTVEKVYEAGAGVSFSQLLVNRLASFDLGAKYRQINSGGSNIINPEGFPQLYALVDSGAGPVYRLFGTFYSPTEFLLKFDPAFVYLNSSVSLLPSIFRSPNALKFDASARQFSNDFFKVPATSSGMFRLPAGHLVFQQSSTSSVLGTKFVYLTGGLYNITQTVPGQISIIGYKDASLYYDEGPYTANAMFGGPPSDPGTRVLAPSLSGDPTPFTGTKNLSLASPVGFYYISPFTDMTLERMLEWSVPARIAGVRKNSDTAALAGTTNKALLSDKDQHLKGRAYDFVPEAMTLAGGGDLVVLPATFARLKILLKQAGFNDGDTKSLLMISKNSLKLTWTYLDGRPGGSAELSNQSPFSAKMYYHTGVTDREVAGAVSQLTPVLEGAAA